MQRTVFLTLWTVAAAALNLKAQRTPGSFLQGATYAKSMFNCLFFPFTQCISDSNTQKYPMNDRGCDGWLASLTQWT